MLVRASVFHFDGSAAPSAIPLAAGPRNWDQRGGLSLSSARAIGTSHRTGTSQAAVHQRRQEFLRTDLSPLGLVSRSTRPQTLRSASEKCRRGTAESRCNSPPLTSILQPSMTSAAQIASSASSRSGGDGLGTPGIDSCRIDAMDDARHRTIEEPSRRPRWCELPTAKGQPPRPQRLRGPAT